MLAMHNCEIEIFGGGQRRPFAHLALLSLQYSLLSPAYAVGNPYS